MRTDDSHRVSPDRAPRRPHHQSRNDYGIAADRWPAESWWRAAPQTPAYRPGAEVATIAEVAFLPDEFTSLTRKAGRRCSRQIRREHQRARRSVPGNGH